jgi:hypothetical protein
MGTIQHHTVVATTWDETRIERLKAWIVEMVAPNWRSSFVFGPVLMNHCQTVMLVPDGSKEGWGVSDAGDVLRRAFEEWLNSEAYEDGSNAWAWIAVSFGEMGTHVQSNQHDRFAETLR